MRYGLILLLGLGLGGCRLFDNADAITCEGEKCQITCEWSGRQWGQEIEGKSIVRLSNAFRQCREIATDMHANGIQLTDCDCPNGEIE